MVGILLVDNHPVSVEGTKAALSKCDDVQLVGQASCIHEALRRVKDLRPDVVIMEAVMPYLDGIEPSLQINCIETTHQIKQIDEKISVIIFTAYPGRDLLRPLLKAGISAYVLKRDPASSLYSAIQAAIQGKNYFSRHLQTRPPNSTEQC
jgi:DNA-binding NarL/FixJ family response regulator